MKIFVKSTPDNYEKEKSGIKNNTVRRLDGKDTIAITNTETGDFFIRNIKDITTYKDLIIITFDELKEAKK